MASAEQPKHSDQDKREKTVAIHYFVHYTNVCAHFTKCAYMHYIAYRVHDRVRTRPVFRLT